MAEERARRRLSTILAADVVGYSTLMEADEETALRTLKGHREIIDRVISRHEGRVFGTAGDSVMAEFGSAVEAVRAAIAIQEELKARNAELPEDSRMVFRIGINLGDVMVDGENLYGDGVNVAARIEGLCAPGEVYVSGVVQGQIEGKLSLGFEDKGEHAVKNIAKQIHVYQVVTNTKTTTHGADEPESLPLPDKPSIAVLAFENMSGDPDQEYFSDGISEDIITELSKISGLFVIARHSSFTYKGQSVTLKEVGQKLGVRYVLEGSVRKAGNRLRITAQLIDTTTDHHLWAERYDREMEDIFEVQDEVAQKVVEALEVTLTPGESRRMAEVPTNNFEAYDAYLRAGRAPWPPTRFNIHSAVSAYEHVIELDPAFAGGYAGKSLAMSMAVLWNYSDDKKRDAAAAIETAKRAIELDPNFALSYSALGLAYSALGNHEEAVAVSRRAVELQPSDADSHAFYSRCLLWAGLIDESCAETETAVRLDPQNASGFHLNMMGRSMFLAGRYEESMRAYERNSELGGVKTIGTLAHWAAACGLAGDLDKACEVIAEIRKERPDLSLDSLDEIYTGYRPGFIGDPEMEHVLKGLRLAWPSE